MSWLQQSKNSYDNANDVLIHLNPIVLTWQKSCIYSTSWRVNLHNNFWYVYTVRYNNVKYKVPKYSSPPPVSLATFFWLFCNYTDSLLQNSIGVKLFQTLVSQNPNEWRREESDLTKACVKLSTRVACGFRSLIVGSRHSDNEMEKKKCINTKSKKAIVLHCKTWM